MLRKMSLLTGLASILFCLTAYSMSVNEIINKNISAIGGMKNIKSINTLKATGKYLISDEVKALVTVQKKRPNKMRLEYTMNDTPVIMGYDGQTAWIKKAGEKARILNENEEKILTNFADIDGPLIDHKEKGINIELIGQQNINNNKAFNLKITYKNGDVINLYLDEKSFLPLKLSTTPIINNQKVQQDIFFKSFKKIHGALLATILETKLNIQPLSSTTKFDSIEANIELNDSLFSMPTNK